MIDDPFSSLCASSILPADSDGFPKDPSDKKVEQGLRKSFEVAAMAIKGASASSMFSRAVCSWSSKLAGADCDLPKEVKDELKKMELASVFVVDASLDTIQRVVRDMAAMMTVRRHTWLKGWEADPAARSKVISIPFRGSLLLWEGLDHYLVEDKDKRKALPSRKKDSKPRKRFHSFQDYRRPSDPQKPRSRSRWH